MMMINSPLVALWGGDAVTRAALHFLLTEDGCEVAEMTTVKALLSTLNARPVDLVAVIAEAKDEGVDVIGVLHQMECAPSTLLLARGVDQSLRRHAFTLGVIDVIGLPAAPRDLRARLGAALRYRQSMREGKKHGPAALRAGGLTLRIAAREVSDEAGWGTRLTAREAMVLQLLMSKPGQPFGRQDHGGNSSLPFNATPHGMSARQPPSADM